MSSKPTNQKRRNNEKRKEKSRVAARCRRTKEVEIFAELTSALPVKKEEVSQLDKASVMRLAISYLRVRDVVSMLPEVPKDRPCMKSPTGLEEVASEVSFMKALDGFVLVLSQQGDIVYCSENIAEHLGVSQMEIMGQSMFEFSHPCDHDEIREALRSPKGKRDLLLRLKCTLTSKGRNVHLKSASYKVIRVTGHMLSTPDKEENGKADRKPFAEDGNDGESLNTLINMGALVAVGRPIPHPSNIEIPLDSKTFLSKHSLDMKFKYTDDALMKTLGYNAEELIGRSLYEYHHAADSGSLVHQFKSLFSKGQCETAQYRFLAKTGGFAWVQTQATLITDKQQKPLSIVCVNYVISGIECKDEVFAAHQVQNADLKPKIDVPSCEAVEIPNGAIVETLPPETEGPIPATKNIFAPRKKKNNGFLMLSEDEGFTMVKDDPGDFTHLAPTAGDACIPLENSPFGSLLDDFELLNNNYCGLWNDDLTNSSPVDSLPNDSILISSPDLLESDSSCEKTSLLTELSLDPFDNRSDNDIDDANSPYIPTGEDLPVLEPAVMWGALPDSVSQAKPQPSEIQTNTSAPALQRLLAAPSTGPPPQDLITNIYSDQGSVLQSKNVSPWDTGVKRGIIKQEEEPFAKRIKRSPTPPKTVSTTPCSTTPKSQTSSVLMNLLDMPQRAKHLVLNRAGSRYEHINHPQTLLNQIPVNTNEMPLPIISVQSPPKNQILHAADSYSNIICPMSPLSVNVNNGSIYSLPSSPSNSMYSPAMSPASRDYLSSPYATPQSLSPVSKYHGYTQSRVSSPGIVKGSDPYLSYRMQPSPNYSMESDIFMDSNVTSPVDFWNHPDLLQEPNDLLSALDDVKLG